jgi:NADH:ubiquinone oxidoreductase subunit D
MWADEIEKLFDIGEMKASKTCKVELDYEYEYHERDEIRSQFLALFSKVKNHLKCYLLLDHTCVHFPNAEKGKDYSLIYHFLNPEDHTRLQITIKMRVCEKMISLRTLWPSIVPLEEEVNRYYGVRYFIGRGVTDLNDSNDLFMLKNTTHKLKVNSKTVESFPYYRLPLQPTNFEKALKWCSVGPNSYPMNGKMRLDLLMDPRTKNVEKAEIRHGYFEKGIEKKCEKLNVYELSLMSMRSSSQNSLFNSLLHCEVIEELSNIKIPERAQAMRMVLSEIARIRSHINYITDMTMKLGFLYEYDTLLKLAGGASHLNHLYHVSTNKYSPFVFGGVCCDLPDGWITEFLEFSKKVHQALDTVRSYLYRNRKFMDETGKIKIKPLNALEFGLTGPALRSCGINYDLRYHQSRYLYRDLDFEIPLGIDGTDYDRFLVHVEEISQSLRIVHQIINFIPSGTLINKDHLYYRDNDESLSEEVPIFPAGETYKSIEGPEGEMGLYAFSIGNKTPYRYHFRSPSLFNSNIFSSLIDKNHMDEVILFLQSLNLDSWELDR